ncbi:DUF1801 domain-containing protein [Chitinophaga qingshengii]|uniref:DUF1801 domain-containing protein n=1 Tax=Chitinophaga qingshengii TaxID=1569794 RepID=A0ABR7TLX6_9BACT|nr:DUF1801 domain-containing protein [Chitinophaga qingshengii]MBC9930978.1 DUF1801 domain-containing protein [Chitinophaga qingshengii]
MLRPIDNYFLQQPEPLRSCLEFMRAYLLKADKCLTENWKYGMPMYYYNGKMCCYLWVHKKYGQPYLGIVEGNKIDHPDLLTEKRARMKILLLDPEQDLPMKKIRLILKQVFALYKHVKKPGKK